MDAYRLSTYLHKDRGEKLKMGPVWDLNIGYGRQDRVPVNDWIANYNNYVQQDAWMVPFWWTRMLEDNVFKSAVKLRWQQLREQTFSNNEIIGLVDDTKAKLISNDAISRNYQRWTGINFQYDQVIEELVFYLENRLQWMDESINTF
ncbi:MAG: CotH kinase family protein [Flavobacteriaceae bacterium]|nr:CotH kinase family protein [Flavobacteriaceae bacterium]